MKKLTTKEFIEKAKEIHGTKYVYSKAIYTGTKGKVIIFCKSCGNEFEQRASHHTAGIGCPYCPRIKAAKKYSSNTCKFIEKAKNLHSDKYDYEKVDYINAKTKVTIICNTCKREFKQTPNSHLSGSGCVTCNRENMLNPQKYTKEQFIEKAVQVHGNKYDYSNVVYINSLTKVELRCNQGHTFYQVPGSHLQGCGCHYCGDYGFDKTKPAILYYLSINNGEVYKIGITNRSVKERFNNIDLEKITILKTWEYPIGKEAYDKEQEILKLYKEFKYTGINILQTGNTELFTENILSIYKEDDNK